MRIHEDPPLNVVLYEPQIPPNTGNIARLCAAVQCHLILLGKLGFELETQLSQQDQMTLNCSTEPGNIPGIGRNLGFVKDNIQWRIFMYPHRSSVFEGKFNQVFQ